jgi:hypothetical protein
MANQLIPLQSTQASSAVTESPVVINFSELPKDVQFQILHRIWKGKDVGNLNLVSKWVNLVNKDSMVATFRCEALFAKYHGIKFDLKKMYSYLDYINIYSHCDFIDLNREIKNLTGEEQLTLIKSKFRGLSVNLDPSKFADKPKRNFDLELFTNLHASQVANIILLDFDILRPVYQLEMLLEVSLSKQATPKMTRKFYDALPVHRQTELRWQIWNANSQSSVTADGIDRGLYFGEYIIDNDINSPLVHAAIRNYLSKFGVNEPANS